MQVTKEWINRFRTVNGAFTGAQTRHLERLFGCKTYISGWMERIEGKEISDEDARIFEEARFIYAKSTKKTLIMESPKKVEEELAQIKSLLLELLNKK